MPVVEELVAVLGFQVRGIPELKKFDGALLQARRRISDFATLLNGRLHSAGFKTGSVLGNLTNTLRSGVSQAALFGARVAWVATKVGALALVLVKLANAYARARAEAALLRNEQQLGAKGKATRVANIDKVARGFTAAGLRPEEASEFIGDIAEKAREARLDPEKDKIFAPNKVRVATKAGRPVDPAAIAVDSIGAWFRLRAQAESAKGSEKQARANRALEQFQKDAGFSDKLVGALSGMASFAEFMRKTRFFNEANPPEPAADTARQDAIGARWVAVANDFAGALGGLSRVLDRVGMTIEEKVLPVFEAFASGLNAFAKKAGLIDQTAGEAELKAEGDRETRRGVARMAHTEPPELAAARRIAAENPGAGGLLAWLLGETPRDAAAGDLDSARRRYEALRGVKERSVGAGYDPKGMEPAIAGAFAEMAEKLRYWQGVTSGLGAGGRNIPLPQPRPSIENSGNDQRTFNINTTVPVQVVPGVGAIGPAAAAAVDQKVLGVVSTKGSNTTTGLINAP